MLSGLDSGAARVRTSGKFFRLGCSKWYVKGFTYGPFAPNRAGEFLPEVAQLCSDFARMRDLGANTVRLYFPPSKLLLDIAQEHDLRVLIDVPWEKHRCFFEDWHAMEAARGEIRRVARELGAHPAVFAISVANEFPNDVVRFYGHARLERFIDGLLDIVHQEAPECLATFANFPTTEFLQPRNVDFHCFNVYLHDDASLGAYLDRLQHLAGSLPLLLGEHGADSFRLGEPGQAEQLVAHVQRTFRHGLAGSIVFSYTDDWYTGGQQIEDWAFGVTRRDRSSKPSARALRETWREAPEGLLSENLPSASVVVCSYNGGRTLEECLDSLMRLNYPDYEVILVDDGSTDATPQIAERYPLIRSIRQENKGLSAARNVGAQAARGEIVAYTDDDCVADEDWLLYLVRGLLDQGVEAIGGPNISPRSDNWIAKCVAASPGNPSHVMLDDRRAEHVPGCNMAYQRDVLLGIGGFDPQFRQAGDDVDLCWRLLDEGYSIGYASGAMVWHHRRCTVRSYFKQQKGYGRSEAMVQFKHPQRFIRPGTPAFRGVIYGDGAVGLPVIPPRIYHGRFGSAPFQTIYREQVYGMRAWVTSLEWHLIALALLLLGLLQPACAIAAASMWCATLAVVVVVARRAPLPCSAPWWCRPLVGFLYLAQPLVRSWHRYTYRLFNKRLPKFESLKLDDACVAKRISPSTLDLYWQSDEGLGRGELLEALVEEARRHRWSGDFQNPWVPWDAWLTGDLWHEITVRTATEELGWPKRFTRARSSVSLTNVSKFTIVAICLWTVAALWTGASWATLLGLVSGAGLAAVLSISRSRCLRAVAQLLDRAGERAGFYSDGLSIESMLSAPREPATMFDPESGEVILAGPPHASPEGGFE